MNKICDRAGCGWTKEPCSSEGVLGTYCSVLCRSVAEQSDFNRVQFAEKEKSIRDRNVGNSDYSKHTIQPWDIWLEYELNPWDADIVKRVLRTKEGDTRRMDYEKIIHICQERIRQLGE